MSSVIGTASRLLVSVSLLVAGCVNDGGSDETSPVAGAWITESCEQVSDSGGSLVNVWMKGLYEFSSEGIIRIGHQGYADADCVTLGESVAPADTPVTYVDKGPQMLQEGIEGAGLNVTVDIPDHFSSVDGYYLISGGRLCFSDRFVFEATTFGVSGLGGDAIDFSQCLVRSSQAQ